MIAAAARITPKVDKVESSEHSATASKKEAPVRFKISNLNFFYGAKQAVFDLNLNIPTKKVTALIGPSGCGKSTFLRTLNRMNETIRHTPRRRGDSSRRPGHPANGCRGAASARRHGFPAAESVSEIDLRQRRLRPAHQRLQRAPRRSRRTQPAPRRAVGRGEGLPAQVGVRAFRRPAAAPVHRARAGRRPRSAAARRAVLGARSR